MPLSATRKTASPADRSTVSPTSPPALRIFGRVVEQVREHLRQADAIAADPDWFLGQHDRHLVPGFLDQRTAGFYGRRHDRRRVHHFQIEANLAAGDPRHVE